MDKVRAGGHQALDTKEVFQSMVKQTMEAFLEVEMEEHLGYAKHDPRAAAPAIPATAIRLRPCAAISARSRSTRLATATATSIQRSSPNARPASAISPSSIISLYARGMTTREIEDHVKEIYGMEISPQFVSRATEQVQQQIIDWQNRPLERVYPVVFVDGLRVAVRTEKGVLNKCVYTVLGVDVAGRQEVLGLWIEETEGARFWLKVLNDLKARGVHDILVLCGDGLTGLTRGVPLRCSRRSMSSCVSSTTSATATKFVLTRIARRSVRQCGRSTRPRPWKRPKWLSIVSSRLGRAVSDGSGFLAQTLGSSHRLFQVPG